MIRSMSLCPMRCAALTLLLVAAMLTAWPGEARAASVNMTKGNTGALIRWPTPNVKYQLHPACSADVNASTCLAEVRKAFKIWVPPTCSKLTFTEGAGSYSVKLTAVGYNTNGANEIAWIEDNAWQSGKYVLGVTSPVFYSTGSKAGSIFEADIAMNGYLQTWAVSGKNYSTDVMNVAVHEIGHFFGLQHNLYPTKSNPETMSPSADPFMKTRTPEQDDINSMCFLYPAGKGLACTANKDCPYVVDDGPNGEFYVGQISCKGGFCNGPAGAVPAGGKKLGDTCVSSADCDKPTFCQPLSGAQSVCSQSCNPSQAGSCPSGYNCYAYQGSTSKGACIKASGGGNNPGSKSLGETCSSSAQCKSQLCVNTGGKTTCEQSCSDTNSCPTGQSCNKFVGKNYGACSTSSGGGGGVTPGKKADGAVCTASSQCDSNICVGSGGSGTCRQNCSSKSCQTGFNCVTLSGGKKGCFPGGTVKLGQPCTSSSVCATSLCGPSSGTYVCTQLCGQGQPQCPGGYQCFQVSGGASACFVATKKKGDGATCAGSSECNSGLCIGTTGGGALCVQPCATDSQCTTGFACSPLQGGKGACTKLGDKKVGDSCSSPSQCSTGTCLTVGGKATCTLKCSSSVDCPCGNECTTFQSGAKYCSAGKKVACVPENGACSADSQCKSELCLNDICTASCSIFATNSGCPTGKGCVRLEAGKPKGVCSTKGPAGFAGACTGDTGCAGLFCNQGKCGRACNPFGPNSCPFSLVCKAELGAVGSCVTSTASGADGATADAGSTAADAAGADGSGAGSGGDDDGNAGGGNTSDAAVQGTTLPPGTGNGSDSGGLCSASPTGDPQSLALLIGLALLALIIIRRRGHRRTAA